MLLPLDLFNCRNQKNILRLAIEADEKEIRETWAGVSLVTYKLPIE